MAVDGRQNIRISQHTFNPPLNAPHTGCAACETTFLGDYFGNDVGAGAHSLVDYATFVSLYGDPVNPAHRQQQVVAKLPGP